MKAMGLAALLAGVGIAGCSGDTGGPMSFLKEGSSPAQLEKDSADCWKFVLDTQEGRNKADVARVKNSIFAATPTGITNREGADRKTDAANRSAYAGCMSRKGYAAR